MIAPVLDDSRFPIRIESLNIRPVRAVRLAAGEDDAPIAAHIPRLFLGDVFLRFGLEKPREFRRDAAHEIAVELRDEIPARVFTRDEKFPRCRAGDTARLHPADALGDIFWQREHCADLAQIGTHEEEECGLP